MVKGFDPIYDENSKILILGSIPSVKSREVKFYYGNKNNRFWKIMENINQIKLNNKKDKLEFLKNNHIALWDTIRECNINGSSDNTISHVKVNDIEKIVKKTKISKIYCTGRKAYDIYNKYIYEKTRIKAIYLPSPSSANASFSLDRLIKIYKELVF